MSWMEETPATVCPTCGADVGPWRRPAVSMDWRDDAEREAGTLAIALMAHRYASHRVEVKLGDLVRYWSPWRGRILGSEVYRVAGIRARDDLHEYARSVIGTDLPPLIGTSYYLVNPARPSVGACWPFVGDPDRPIVFEIVTAAPPGEVDLLDLLGWDAAS